MTAGGTLAHIIPEELSGASVTLPAASYANVLVETTELSLNLLTVLAVTLLRLL